MEYKIKNPLGNSPVVTYACPGCGASLKSPIQEAGDSDSCPGCRTTFTVPGVEGLQIWKERRAQAKQYEQKAAASQAAEQKLAVDKRRGDEQRKTEERRLAKELRSSGRSRKSNIIESVVLAVASLCIMVGGVLSNPIPDKPWPVDRFRTDNAPAATANAVEDLVYSTAKNHAELQRTLYWCTGLIIAAIAANTLRRERRHLRGVEDHPSD